MDPIKDTFCGTRPLRTSAIELFTRSVKRIPFLVMLMMSINALVRDQKAYQMVLIVRDQKENTI